MLNWIFQMNVKGWQDALVTALAVTLLIVMTLLVHELGKPVRKNKAQEKQANEGFLKALGGSGHNRTR